jgi:predicted XRE-type DNA-binding protein
MSTRIEHTIGSGNVFQDLGLADPEVALVKADLARAIASIIRERGLTQAAAAEQMGLDQPKVSAISRGRLAGFSVERLLECLKALHQEVTIAVRPTGEERGQIRVQTGR